MNRFPAAFLALARGAALAMLLAGLCDALAVALGGGADLRAVAAGAVLLAVATGAVHEGAGALPLQASFAWLGLGAALPLFAGFAPWTALGGALLFLPLRALGARISGMLAAAERPGAWLGAHVLGAALGLCWLSGRGLGLAGYLLACAAAGLLVARAPTPAVEAPGDSLAPLRRLGARAARVALGAGLVWTWLLLAPMARSFDAAHAGQDAQAAITVLCFAAIGWLTFGALAAESARQWAWAALAAGALGLTLPLAVRGIGDLAEPLAFDARLRVELLRNLFEHDTPRLQELNAAYVPWVLLSTVGLPIVLAAIALRGVFGRQPTGPDDLAPLGVGAGAALVAASMPLGAAGGEPAWLGTAALSALLASAAIALAARPGAPLARTSVAVALAAGAVFLARPVPPPRISFPMQDMREWRVARDALGAPLARAGRDALWRIVEHPGEPPEQHLARGRNLLTPDLDEPGTWERDVALALACAPRAQRALFAGAPHPASLRAAAAGGVRELVAACDPAAADLLRRRDPQGYGAKWSAAPSLARAPGRFDLVLLRSQAQWDRPNLMLDAASATQARHRLAPGGVAALALDPEQLAPGVLSAVAAAWLRAFGSAHLIAAPDGLRGVRLLLLGFDEEERPLPPELQPLAVPAETLSRTAAGIGALVAPLPRVHGPLAATVWRQVDELRATRRAQAVVEELLAGEAAGAPPSLLRAAALQYAAQEYSSHDTYLVIGPDAIELSRPALEELARWARAWPEAAWVRATWADAAATLAAKREAGLVEEFVRPLRVELGWREPGISLPLARAALELLDEEEARALLAEILEGEPGHAEAAQLLRVLQGEEPLAPDAHQGHDHR